MKQKNNLKMFWSIGGLLIFGALLIGVFEGIGFGGFDVINIWGDIRWSGPVRLHNLNGFAGDVHTIYGSGIAAIVFAWLAIIIPIITLFISKKNVKYILFGIVILFIAIALACGLTAELIGWKITAMNDGQKLWSLAMILTGVAIGLSTNLYSFLAKPFIPKTEKVSLLTFDNEEEIQKETINYNKKTKHQINNKFLNNGTDILIRIKADAQTKINITINNENVKPVYQENYADKITEEELKNNDENSSNITNMNENYEEALVTN